MKVFTTPVDPAHYVKRVEQIQQPILPVALVAAAPHLLSGASGPQATEHGLDLPEMPSTAEVPHQSMKFGMARLHELQSEPHGNRPWIDSGNARKDNTLAALGVLSSWGTGGLAMVAIGGLKMLGKQGAGRLGSFLSSRGAAPSGNLVMRAAQHTPTQVSDKAATHLLNTLLRKHQGNAAEALKALQSLRDTYTIILNRYKIIDQQVTSGFPIPKVPQKGLAQATYEKVITNPIARQSQIATYEMRLQLTKKAIERLLTPL